MSPKPKNHQLSEMMEFAAELAREAGKITLHYFRRGVEVERKSDDSPVTIADKETEKYIRKHIEEKYPDHGILGEEFGETNPGARYRWIIDPIDGTQAFIHGVPLYTVLIALECAGESQVGIIHNPFLDETAAAAVGCGCTLNGQPCQVSKTDELSRARIHATDWSDVMRRNPKFCTALLSQTKFSRTWADAYGYLMVACGRADVMLDPIMNLWDSAALKPIIEEAGGRFTDLRGITTTHNPSALATNGLLHDRLLDLVRLDYNNE